MAACSYGQTLPVGQLDIDGWLRNQQLLGGLDPQVSFTARPLYMRSVVQPKRGLVTDSSFLTSAPGSSLRLKKGSFAGGKGEWAVLPFLWKTKFNSHHPYGWNDEGMIAAKGLQSQFSAGVYAGYGPLTVQLQPQWVWADNPSFTSNAAYGAPGNGSYQSFFAGQSSVRLHAGPLSLGLSTENLWMGPGQYSSLLMSNNAPGFAHISFNTTRPIKTWVGSFEFQLISGRLREDSAAGGLYENFHLKPVNLKNQWRYLNAMVVSYQPRFIKGLFLGATRAFQLYGDNIDQPGLGFMNKYIPVLSALFKNNAGGAIEDARGRDQQVSLFSRWIFPKNHLELYLEYGWNDHKANSRDFILDPEHSAAYIVGAKKIVPLHSSPGAFLEFNAEFTHMSQSVDYVLRNSSNWYEHGQVLQGMTHQRQILGAGSGFGNNVQTIQLNWLKDLKKVGLTIQRIQHDPKGVVSGNLSTLGLRSVSWNETTIGIQGRWPFGRWMATADIHHVRSDNYAWERGNKLTNWFGLFSLGYMW